MSSVSVSFSLDELPFVVKRAGEYVVGWTPHSIEWTRNRRLAVRFRDAVEARRCADYVLGNVIRIVARKGAPS